VLFIAPPPGLSQEADEAPAPAAEEDEEPAPAGGGEQKPSFRWARVELYGRFIGFWQSVHQGDASESDFDVESARLGLDWRPARWLRGQLEYDAATNNKLKDAYLAARTDRFSFRGGQFKPPFSVVDMESQWDLPVADRGQLDDVLRDSFGIVGRRPGFQGGYQPRGGDTRAFLGVFRASSVRGDRIGSGAFHNLAKDWALKYTGRVQHRRRRLELGLSADYRPAEPLPGEGYQHFWTLGLDATWRQRRSEGGWRLWGEGFYGSSWQDSDPFDGVDAIFVAGRAIAAWRHGGRRRRAFYIEPYTLLSVLDPDTSVRDDLLWEIAGGVNVGRWDQGRLTVAVQRREAQANAPPSLGLVFFDAPPYSRTRLVLQIGGVF
jgi:hypothetical protein